MSVREVLGLSDAVRSEFFKKRLVKPVAESIPGASPPKSNLNRIQARLDPRRVADSPKARVTVNGTEIALALLDTGAEMNVCTRDLAIKAGLAMSSPDLKMVPYAGAATDFEGVCENVELRIGGLTLLQHIYVARDGDHALLLGQPFTFATEMSFDYEDDGMFAKLSAAGNQVRVRVAELPVRKTPGKV